MFAKSLVAVLFFFCTVSFVSAQENDFQSFINYKVDKMQKELKLTDVQANAVKPIVAKYLSKRHELLQQVAGQGIVDHVSVKRTLKDLQNEENGQLSKILTEEQLKKWINKERLMEVMNPDGMESSLDDGPSLTGEGAAFKF